MADERLGATRTELLLLKGLEEAAREGLSLLKGKREALVADLFAVVDEAVSARDRYAGALLSAEDALAVSLGLDGCAGVESAAFAARRDIPVRLVEKNLWGVRFPVIEARGVVRASDARGYAYPAVSSATNAAARGFEKALEAAIGIVQYEGRLRRMGAEVRKATRRINVLTETILPRLRSRMRAVRLALEEREREDVFRMKRFKKASAHRRKVQERP
ncbi:MAG: V-type ATP synthase subunit D [Gemmatimonadota bacterium]